MKSPKLLGTVKPYVAAIAVTLMASVLVACIYFTLLDLAWVTFLAGIVFASLLAMVSRATHAEYMAATRGAKLAVNEAQLAEETRLRQKAEEVLARVHATLQFSDELLPAMVAYVDAEGVCRYHNHAFRRLLDLPVHRINGHHLREALGRVVFAQMEAAVLRAFSGEAVRYERTHKLPSSLAARLNVQFLPVGHGHEAPGGFFMVLTTIAEPDAVLASIVPGPAAPVLAEQARFDSAVAEHVTEKADARKIILAAIERNEFSLLGQLIEPLDPAAGRPRHHEILIRLREEEDSMIVPGAFFPLAEEHGLLPNLDRWVVASVMHWVAGRGKAESGAGLVFINIATPTLRDPFFTEYVEQQLYKNELSGGLLCFEIAEGDVLSHRGDVDEFVRRIKLAGCRVALSGFGRSRISVAVLKDLPLDFLKVDGSVIRNILRDPLSMSKLVAINRFAKSIGITTVAEMVEDAATAASLRDIAVDYSQGFGISAPRPLAELR